MPTINPALPADGDDAIVEPYNVAILAILSLINGGLDTDNFASVPGGKLVDGSVTEVKMANDARTGWHPTTAPNACTPNGRGSYSIVVPLVDLTSQISKGMRLKLTRSSTAPTKCTSLNGTTQFYSKSSPNKLTTTDDFACAAWIKISAYQTGGIISRYNGTSGWQFWVDSTGVIYLQGFNAGATNWSRVLSNQSLPLNRWVHVVAQLDMSSFVAGPVNSYVMIDGLDVPVTIARNGSNPTALIEAGNLEVGSWNGGTNTFAGKLAQVAVYNAKIIQSVMLSTISQGLAGTESNLASGYSFNNSITDLNTSAPNDLTANNAAVATNADSPFALDVNGVPTGTIEYGIVQSVIFSTNTTIVVQTPQGGCLPTSGGISAMSYATDKIPFGFPASRTLWRLETIYRNDVSQSSPTTTTWYNFAQASAPIGCWNTGWEAGFNSSIASAGVWTMKVTLSAANNTETASRLTAGTVGGNNATSSATENPLFAHREYPQDFAALTTQYLNAEVLATGIASINMEGSTGDAVIFYENALL